jgi:hypothetical protein
MVNTRNRGANENSNNNNNNNNVNPPPPPTLEQVLIMQAQLLHHAIDYGKHATGAGSVASTTTPTT